MYSKLLSMSTVANSSVFWSISVLEPPKWFVRKIGRRPKIFPVFRCFLVFFCCYVYQVCRNCWEITFVKKKQQKAKNKPENRQWTKPKEKNEVFFEEEWNCWSKTAFYESLGFNSIYFSGLWILDFLEGLHDLVTGFIVSWSNLSLHWEKAFPNPQKNQKRMCYLQTTPSGMFFWMEWGRLG